VVVDPYDDASGSVIMGAPVTEVQKAMEAAESGTEAVVEDLTPPPRSRSKTWIVRLVSIIVVLGAWEILGRQVNPLFMSYPSAIAKASVALVASGELLEALKSSMLTLLIGFVTASIIGILSGLLIGRYRYVDAATDWIVNALYATPLIAIIPLVILWFGLGDAAKLFIVTILAVFPVLINTASGVRNVPSALIDVGAAFAANERQVFMKIILPAVLPYIMTGLRLGIGRAIIGMVAAEFFTAITGLGALIVKYGNQYDTASMFVPILILMLLGVSLTTLVRRVEEMFAPWRGRND
jgi:ABC-type nitrate/sulfonate/bicarbonate transport system permease component